MKRGLAPAIAPLALTAVLLGAPAAAADPVPAREGTEERARLAGEHFRRGREAYLRRDFHGAGRAFDEAFAATPHHDALWNAAQAWESAGEIARAANRYAAYLRLAPPNARDRPQATTALASLTRRLGRLHVFATAAEQPRVDGEIVTADVFYVYPGTHVVTIQRERGTTEREVSVAAQEDQSVSFGAEPAPPTLEPPATAPAPSPAAPPAPPPGEPSRGARVLPRWTVLAGGGLTLAGAAVTSFFGLRSLDARDTFDRRPSAELLDAGRDDQTRANVALGVTIGLAVLTASAALFLVDWRSPRAPARTGLR